MATPFPASSSGPMVPETDDIDPIGDEDVMGFIKSGEGSPCRAGPRRLAATLDAFGAPAAPGLVPGGTAPVTGPGQVAAPWLPPPPSGTAAASFTPGTAEPGGAAAASAAADLHAAAGVPTVDREESWRDWDNWVGLASDPEILICFPTAHWTCLR
eukprot:13201651-Alexandrium_andersonii.AAC.1